jgi:hypothetical protein
MQKDSKLTFSHKGGSVIKIPEKPFYILSRLIVVGEKMLAIVVNTDRKNSFYWDGTRRLVAESASSRKYREWRLWANSGRSGE